MFLLWFANTLQIEVLIHLVPKVLEPNKLPIWQSVTKHIKKMKCLKLKKKKKKKLEFNVDQFYAETPQNTMFYE